MKLKDITLSELCLQSLIRNKEKFQVIGNIPYRLIEKYLKRININANQLMKYERFNVEWIFDADEEELWLNFLKVDFPTNIHEKYVNNKDSIVKYYKDAIRDIYDNKNKNNINKEDNDKLNKIILKNKVSDTIKRDINTKKYKVPYRMLYLQYQEDIKLKEAKITENLRLQMQRIKEERDKKSTVVVGEQFYIDNTVGKNRRNYRKRRLMDKMYITSFNRGFKSQGDTRQLNENKRHIERVAFGGMAGKQIDPRLFKKISNTQLVKNTNEDDTISGQCIENNTSINITTNVRNSSIGNANGTAAAAAAATKKIQTPSRKQRNGLEQNIFLKRKRPLCRQSLSPTKSTPNSHSSNNKITAANTLRSSNSNSIANNRTTTIVTGTKRKRSNIFQQPKHPYTQPHHCDNLEIHTRAVEIKDEERNNNNNKNSRQSSSNDETTRDGTLLSYDSYKPNIAATTTTTIIINTNTTAGQQDTGGNEDKKKRKIYSLTSYLQRKKEKKQ